MNENLPKPVTMSINIEDEFERVDTIGDHIYLHTQSRSDGGADFTFYDANTKSEIDGGVIDADELDAMRKRGDTHLKLIYACCDIASIEKVKEIFDSSVSELEEMLGQ